MKMGRKDGGYFGAGSLTIYDDAASAQSTAGFCDGGQCSPKPRLRPQRGRGENHLAGNVLKQLLATGNGSDIPG